MNYSRALLFFTLFITALASRLIPHPPNCTAINAIALLGSSYLGSLGFSLSLLFAVLFVSDCIIGFHSMMIFVYLAFGIIALLNAKRLLSKNVWLSSFLGSSLFFVIANCGEWALGTLYPKTFEGLTQCFLMALPFFGNQVCGDLFYCALLSFSFRYCLRLNEETVSI